MTAPGSIRGIIRWIKAAVKDPAPDSRQIIGINVRHVLDIPNSGVRIGPLTCRDWYQLLVKYFNKVRENSVQVRVRFDDPFPLLAVDATYPSANNEKAVRRSLSLQFIGGFGAFAAERIAGDQQETRIYSLIFTFLCRVSYQMQERLVRNQPFAGSFATENEALAQLSERLPVRFKISG
jgi:hypothetical protein